MDRIESVNSLVNVPRLPGDPDQNKALQKHSSIESTASYALLFTALTCSSFLIALLYIYVNNMVHRDFGIFLWASAITLGLFGTIIIKLCKLRNKLVIGLLPFISIPVGIFFSSIVYTGFESNQHAHSMYLDEQLSKERSDSQDYVSMRKIEKNQYDVTFPISLSILIAALVVIVLVDRAGWPFSEISNDWLRPFSVRQRFTIKSGKEKMINMDIIDFNFIVNSRPTENKRNSGEMILFVDHIPDGKYVLGVICRTGDGIFPFKRSKYILLGKEQFAEIVQKFGPIKEYSIHFRRIELPRESI